MAERRLKRGQTQNEHRRKEKRKVLLRTSPQKKLAVLQWFFTVSVLALIMVILYEKLFFGDEYEKKAIAQQMNAVVERVTTPNRGNILDRNQQSIAVSSTVYNVILDVKNLWDQTITDEDRNFTLTKLNEILGTPMADLENYMQNKKDSSYVIVEKGVEKKIQEELAALQLKDAEVQIKGVYFEDDTKRTYVHNELAAQVVGFIRGTPWGLENYYNEEMTGEPGRIFRQYDQYNVPVTSVIPPVQGNTLITTLDIPIQKAAEEVCKTYAEQFKAASSSAIVMNPNTGEIYAMAEYPSFNLNAPDDVSQMNKEALITEWSGLGDDEKINNMMGIWRNLNVTDTFEPGSTFKPITVAAALEEGIISPNDTFYCSGSKHFDELIDFNDYDGIPCHNTSGHGEQTLEQAIANSCNVAMMQIVEKMGREIFYKYQNDFGYGEKTGIDFPGEADVSGLMYTLAQLNNTELATSSFGQGFNCTPIQAISSFAALINGGNLYKPHLVSQIVDSSGNVIKDNQKELVRRVISKETSDYLRLAMEKTVSEGTGYKARIEGYTFGGKTATAQQQVREDGKVNISYIAYLPVEDPQYLVQVLITTPDKDLYDQGVASPAPMLKELLEKIIDYKSIPQSYNPLDPYSETAYVSGQTRELPDFTGKGLREAVAELEALGVSYSFAGVGGPVVTGQIPPAGAAWSENMAVTLLVEAQDGYEGELVTVPDVNGYAIEAAEAILSGAGLEIIVEETVSEEEMAGITYGQVPEMGYKVVPNAYVKLKVNVPPEGQDEGTEEPEEQ